MRKALADDVRDAQIELTLFESRVLRIKSGVKRLARTKPNLKDELREASAAVVKAYKDLLELDEKLSNLEDVIDLEPKIERELEEEQAYVENLENDSSSSSEDDEDHDNEFVFASESYRTPVKKSDNFPLESYKTPVKKPGRKLDLGTPNQKKRVRKF